MTAETDISRLQERIAQLSTLRQRLLFERLRRSGQLSSSKGGRLVAFYQAEAPIEADELRSLCGQQLPAHMVPQRFIQQDVLALTPAGKLDRDGMRARLWSQDSFPVEHEEVTAARTDIEKTLAEIWADVLGFDEISVFDNFFEAGGDSLQIIRIISRASKAGLSIQPDAIFSNPTIAELALVADQAQEKATDNTVGVGELPLLPIQSWFFDVIGPAKHYWNQSFLFELHGSPESGRIQRAIELLLAHHDGLRTQFVNEQGRWKSSIAARVNPAFRTVMLSAASPDAQLDEMRSIANSENAAMDLATGPLFRAIHFSGEGGRGYLVLIAHHLIVDAVSWQVVITDLNTLLSDDAGVQRLSTVTTPLKLWAEQLQQLAQRQDIKDTAGFWLEQAERVQVTLPATERSLEVNTEGACQTLTRALDADRSEVLRQVLPKELRTSVQELLLSALVRVLTRWCDRAGITLDMEGHGRDPLVDNVDVSQTVGWCTTVFPVTFSGSDMAYWNDPLDALRTVKEQFRRVPHSGLSHGLLMYMSDDGEVRSGLKDAPRSHVLFNYLGREQEPDDQDAQFSLVEARFAQLRAPDNHRAYVLELNAVFRNDQLMIDWAFCPALHEPELIAQLADDYFAYLNELVEGSANAGSSAITPADFPLAGLDQVALDNLSSQLDEVDDE